MQGKLTVLRLEFRVRKYYSENRVVNNEERRSRVMADKETVDLLKSWGFEDKFVQHFEGKCYINIRYSALILR